MKPCNYGNLDNEHLDKNPHVWNAFLAGNLIIGFYFITFSVLLRFPQLFPFFVSIY